MSKVSLETNTLAKFNENQISFIKENIVVETFEEGHFMYDESFNDKKEGTEKNESSIYVVIEGNIYDLSKIILDLDEEGLL